MKRLINGLTLILVMLSTLFALHLLNAQTSTFPGGIAVTNSWKVDDLLGSAMTTDEETGQLVDSVLQNRTHVSGFALTPGSADLIVHQIPPENADDDPTYEFDFSLTPTEMWFIVRDSMSDTASLELASIYFDGGTVMEKMPPIRVEETLFNQSPANLRLAVQAIPGPKPGIVPPWSDPDSEEGPAPVVNLYIQPTAPIVHVIDPFYERIMAVDPVSKLYAVYDATMYDGFEYIPEVGSPEIRSRAPADTAGHPIRDENAAALLVYGSAQPTVAEFFSDPDIWWPIGAGSPSSVEAFLTLRYSLGSGDIPYVFDDPERFFVIDRESQVDQPWAPYNGQMRDDSQAAQLRTVTTIASPAGIGVLSSVFLSQTMDVTLTKNEDGTALTPVFPLGATIDYDPFNDTLLGALRTGGLEDTVVRSGFFNKEDSNVPGSMDPLFTSFHINRNFPIRIQEMDVDSDGSLWMLTETLQDLDGQIWDNLYRIDLTASETLYGGFPRPIYPPPNNAGVRGDVVGDGRLDITNVVSMFEYLNAFGDPNSDSDPDVLWRSDVDANGIFDTMDRDQIISINLSSPDLPEPLHQGNITQNNVISFGGNVYSAMYGIFDEIDQVHDVEVVDLDDDGWPDVTALVSNSSGDFLWVFENQRDPVTPYVGVTYMVPLDFPARHMVWINVPLTGETAVSTYPSLALVNSTSDTEGQLRIYETSRSMDEQYAFELRRTFSAGINPEQLTVGQFNADETEDLVIGNNAGGYNVRVYVNDNDYNFSQQLFAADKTPLGIDMAQIDYHSPRTRNMIIASSDTDALALYEQQGGSQVLQDVADLWNEPVDTFIARMVHDAEDYLSNSDIVAIESPGLGNNPDIELFTVEDGEMTLSRSIAIPGLVNATEGEVGDFNLDGLDDVVLIGFPASTNPWNITGISVYAIYGSSLSNLGFNDQLANGYALYGSVEVGIFGDVELADLDGDGDDDLIFSIVQIPIQYPARNGIYFYENTQELRSPMGPGEIENATLEEEF